MPRKSRNRYSSYNLKKQMNCYESVFTYETNDVATKKSNSKGIPIISFDFRLGTVKLFFVDCVYTEKLC